MRGVPARHLGSFVRRSVHLARYVRPGQLAERMTHGALRRGVLRRDAWHRRGGQRPATMRSHARGSGPGCPATYGESPQHPLPLRRAALPRSFALSVLILRWSRRGPVGLARRRWALEEAEKLVADQLVLDEQARQLHGTMSVSSLPPARGLTLAVKPNRK
jgi:hypothetical protein